MCVYTHKVQPQSLHSIHPPIMAITDSIISGIISFTPTLVTATSRQIGYVRNHQEHVKKLIEAAEELRAKRHDIEIVHNAAVNSGRTPTQLSEYWVKKAKTVENAIESIRPEPIERRGTFFDIMSHYKLGKRAAKKLEDVQRLINEGNNFGHDQLVHQFSAPPAPPRISLKQLPHQISFKKTMDEVWDHLMDESNNIVCVYGMGGIGKTLLMKAIESRLQELQAKEKFDDVAFVTLSKNSDTESVQKDIMDKLGLMFDEHSPFLQRYRQLSQWLSRKRYVLILDNLCRKIELKDVGIPMPDDKNRFKILITTRLVDVCNEMHASAKIRMKTLTEDEAWDLFAANVGEVVNNDEEQIENIAKDVVAECGGLPLAILTVARALRDRRAKEVWENALRVLRSSEPEIGSIKSEVFQRLKQSYDELEDHKVKMCFLCCSLFPKGCEMCVDDLINIWTVEGLLQNVDNFVEASSKGHSIVQRLKDICLLEEGPRAPSHGNSVKMHAVIRSLAIWITSLSSHEGEGPRSLVKAGKKLKETPDEEKWEEFEIISLMQNEITELPPRPNCRNLVSLFLRDNPGISAIPCTFFELMPILKVLDLSETNIETLTVSSSSLLNLKALFLKGCKALRELKFLGQLKELQILDLSKSSITSLPHEMRNLVKLRKLNVSYIEDNSLTIPSNIISGWSSMEVLRMMTTEVNWAERCELEVATKATLGELAELKHLTSLEICFHDIDCVEEDVFRWQWSQLKKFKIIIGSYSMTEDLHWDKQMQIYGAKIFPPAVKEIATHTQSLTLCAVNANEEEHVSKFVDDLENLKALCLRSCQFLKWIFDSGAAVEEGALQKIEHLKLHGLPNLKKLFEGKVPKGCLKNLTRIEVQDCNALKSLFPSEMVENLDQLKVIDVRHCDELEEIIQGNFRIKEKTPEGDKSVPQEPLLRFRSLKLSDLELLNSGELEKIVEGNLRFKKEAVQILLEEPLQKLNSLKLYELPKLRSIIGLDKVALSKLKHYEISKCPNLRLPECRNLPESLLGKKGKLPAIRKNQSATKISPQL